MKAWWAALKLRLIRWNERRKAKPSRQVVKALESWPTWHAASMGTTEAYRPHEAVKEAHQTDAYNDGVRRMVQVTAMDKLKHKVKEAKRKARARTITHTDSQGRTWYQHIGRDGHTHVVKPWEKAEARAKAKATAKAIVEGTAKLMAHTWVMVGLMAMAQGCVTWSTAKPWAIGCGGCQVACQANHCIHWDHTHD